MLGYLEKDTSGLVRDAEPLRNAFKAIKDELSLELSSVISPAAFIEGQESNFWRPSNA